MSRLHTTLALIVVASLLAVPVVSRAQSLSAQAEAAEEVERLLAELRDPAAENVAALEDDLLRIWSRSGSATADLLLRRGQEAMQAEDFDAALDHLSALIDHAPEFAEGWNARALVYFQQERLGLALSDVIRSLDLNPSNFNALSGLAIMLEQTDLPEAALDAYEQALKLNPHRENVAEAIERLRRKIGASTL